MPIKPSVPEMTDEFFISLLIGLKIDPQARDWPEGLVIYARRVWVASCEAQRKVDAEIARGDIGKTAAGERIAAAIERGADTAISPSLPLDDPFDR